MTRTSEHVSPGHPDKVANYEVTLETVTLNGISTSSTTMTDAQLKA